MDPKTDTQTDGTDMSQQGMPNASPPSVGPTYDKALVYDDDGKPWREKFHGLAGRTQQLEKELNQAQQQYQQALDEYQTELGKREGAIEQLNSKLEGAGEQLGQLQGLKDRIPDLETKARRAELLEAILEYPTLATLQVKDTVTTEEGEEHELLTNPVMNLVLGSNLEGDALRAELRRLSDLYKQMGELPGQQPQSQNVTGGAAPSPGEPVEQTAEYWEQKAAEAHKKSILSEAASEQQEWIDRRTEYSQKAREARAAAS